MPPKPPLAAHLSPEFDLTVPEALSDRGASGFPARDGSVTTSPRNALGFGYDTSRLKQTGEILVWAEFSVGVGEPDELRRTARESLAFRKRTQPLDTPSAGCIFQNPEAGRDVVPDGLPWSDGALVDRAGMKGTALGGALACIMAAGG